MDNITHTLIGTLIGEATARGSRPDAAGLPADARRNLIVALSAAGSNLPDLDLLYSFLGDKVNYLLHHRGHTHTLLGALVLAGIALAIAMWWMRRRGLVASARDRRWLAAVLAMTSLLHVGMDATNNYGVHPFWPVYNGWMYGDAVFIMEPLLWAVCAPLVVLLRTGSARFIVAMILVLGIALSFSTGLVPIAAALTVAILTVGLLVLARRASPRVALSAAIALWLGVTAAFIATSRVAGRRADALAAQAFPAARLLDRVLTPMPANPLCWELMLVQRQADEAILRRAMLALVPSWITAQRCPSRSLNVAPTAPLRAVQAPDSAAVKWYGEIGTRIDRLARAIAGNCQAAAAMLFMRAPWLASIDGAKVLGDLRYDREPARGFAEIELSEGTPSCPKLVPPWPQPRADLLR